MVLSDKGFRQAPFERSTPKLPVMTYVIGKECVDVMHKDCVQECPAYCIYERARSLYINQYEYVDCGACKLICDMRGRRDPLRNRPAGGCATLHWDLRGGACRVDRVGVDTPYVTSLPART